MPFPISVPILIVLRQWLFFLRLTNNYNYMVTTLYTKKNRCSLKFAYIYEMLNNMLGLKKVLLTYSLIYEVWVKSLWMKIVQVSIVLRRTVIDVDRRFDNCSGSHLQSQVRNKRQDSRTCYLVLTSSYCVYSKCVSVWVSIVYLIYVCVFEFVSIYFYFAFVYLICVCVLQIWATVVYSIMQQLT